MEPLSTNHLKSLEKTLTGMENKLKKLDEGDFKGRIVRQVVAGLERLMRLFKGHWISRQKHAIDTLTKELAHLEKQYELITINDFSQSELNSIQNLNYQLEDRLAQMQKICSYARRHIKDRKVTNLEIQTVETEIAKFIFKIDANIEQIDTIKHDSAEAILGKIEMKQEEIRILFEKKNQLRDLITSTPKDKPRTLEDDTYFKLYMDVQHAKPAALKKALIAIPSLLREGFNKFKSPTRKTEYHFLLLYEKLLNTPAVKKVFADPHIDISKIASQLVTPILAIMSKNLGTLNEKKLWEDDVKFIQLNKKFMSALKHESLSKKETLSKFEKAWLSEIQAELYPEKNLLDVVKLIVKEVRASYSSKVSVDNTKKALIQEIENKLATERQNLANLFIQLNQFER